MPDLHPQDTWHLTLDPCSIYLSLSLYLSYFFMLHTQFFFMYVQVCCVAV